MAGKATINRVRKRRRTSEFLTKVLKDLAEARRQREQGQTKIVRIRRNQKDT
jgi:hypothetical protein